MVKKREPRATRQPTREEIEAFAAGADGGEAALMAQAALEKNAKRDFKSIRMPFNQFEYEQLDAAAKAAGRTKVNFIRYAIAQLAEEILQDKEG